MLPDPAAQAAARAREAAARQRQAQKDFERYQKICGDAGYDNCDQPQQGPFNESSSFIGDACEILAAATGLYGATNVPVLKPAPKVHIYGKTPGGRPYTAHYSLDRANRKIPPSVVDNTIDTTKGTPGRNGTTVHYDPVNNVTVVTGDGQSIVTVHRGKP